ncbi:MAG: Ser-Thr-rich GPI-anchored membrane family protein [Patescibacteria group bacterium]
MTPIPNTIVPATDGESVTVVQPPPPAVVFPTAGSKLEAGRSYTLQWTPSAIKYSGSDSPKVSLVLRVASAFKTTIVSDIPNSGSYVWHVPSSLSLASDYVVRIWNQDRTQLADSGNFEIVPAVIFPTAGSKLQAGQPYTLQWTPSAVRYGGADSPNVSLVFRNVSGAYKKTIASGIPNSGSYTWTVPTDIPLATDYFLRIWNQNNSNSVDSSKFEVVSATGAFRANSSMATVLAGLIQYLEELRAQLVRLSK